MFKITDGAGFHITFENGVTLSVQFGPHNYCKGRYETQEPGWRSSPNAEIALWRNEDDTWLTRECFRDLYGTEELEDVVGWVSPDQLAQVIAWIQAKKF